MGQRGDPSTPTCRSTMPRLDKPWPTVVLVAHKHVWLRLRRRDTAIIPPPFRKRGGMPREGSLAARGPVAPGNVLRFRKTARAKQPSAPTPNGDRDGVVELGCLVNAARGAPGRAMLAAGVRIGLYRRGDGATRSGCPMSFGPFAGTYDPLFRGAWLSGLTVSATRRRSTPTYRRSASMGVTIARLGVTKPTSTAQRHGFFVRATAIAPVPWHLGTDASDVARAQLPLRARSHRLGVVGVQGRKPPATVLPKSKRRAVQVPDRRRARSVRQLAAQEASGARRRQTSE